jgi:hypothetical protein
VQLYGSVQPEPVWVLNNRRRHLGHPIDPYYLPGAYSTTQNFGPYTRGSLVPVSLELLLFLTTKLLCEAAPKASKFVISAVVKLPV